MHSRNESLIQRFLGSSRRGRRAPSSRSTSSPSSTWAGTTRAARLTWSWSTSSARTSSTSPSASARWRPTSRCGSACRPLLGLAKASHCRRGIVHRDIKPANLFSHGAGWRRDARQGPRLRDRYKVDERRYLDSGEKKRPITRTDRSVGSPALHVSRADPGQGHGRPPIRPCGRSVRLYQMICRPHALRTTSSPWATLIVAVRTTPVDPIPRARALGRSDGSRGRSSTRSSSSPPSGYQSADEMRAGPSRPSSRRARRSPPRCSCPRGRPGPAPRGRCWALAPPWGPRRRPGPSMHPRRGRPRRSYTSVADEARRRSPPTGRSRSPAASATPAPHVAIAGVSHVPRLPPRPSARGAQGAAPRQLAPLGVLFSYPQPSPQPQQQASSRVHGPPGWPSWSRASWEGTVVVVAMLALFWWGRHNKEREREREARGMGQYPTVQLPSLVPTSPAPALTDAGAPSPCRLDPAALAGVWKSDSGVQYDADSQRGRGPLPHPRRDDPQRPRVRGRGRLVSAARALGLHRHLPGRGPRAPAAARGDVVRPPARAQELHGDLDRGRRRAASRRGSRATGCRSRHVTVNAPGSSFRPGQAAEGRASRSAPASRRRPSRPPSSGSAAARGTTQARPTTRAPPPPSAHGAPRAPPTPSAPRTAASPACAGRTASGPAATATRTAPPTAA